MLPWEGKKAMRLAMESPHILKKKSAKNNLVDYTLLNALSLDFHSDVIQMSFMIYG